MERVGDVGEDALVARIAARLGPPPADEVWSGDDAAVLAPTERSLVFTTDLLIERVDFELAWATPRDVGWKALAASASDVAAMGGRPRHAVVALCLGSEAETAFVDELLSGLLEAGARWGISLAGGDLSRGPVVVVCVAMLGATATTGPILRSSARVGDAICVTGSLGGAAAGLQALTAPPRRGTSGSGALARLVARQLRPAARVEQGATLASLGVTSMIDLSDGLAADLARLLAASEVGCDVDPARVPIDPDLMEAVGAGELQAADPLRLALAGGEDFELLFTIEETRVPAVRSALEESGCAVTQIGVVTSGVRRVGDEDLETWRQRGWDHFRGR
jgi:thiamine-monophosphate kinase